MLIWQNTPSCKCTISTHAVEQMHYIVSLFIMIEVTFFSLNVEGVVQPYETKVAFEVRTSPCSWFLASSAADLVYCKEKQEKTKPLALIMALAFLNG